MEAASLVYRRGLDGIHCSMLAEVAGLKPERRLSLDRQLRSCGVMRFDIFVKDGNELRDNLVAA
jgi:hypothetical protein